MSAIRVILLATTALCAACSSPGTIGVPGPLSLSTSVTATPAEPTAGPSATSGGRPAIVVRTPAAGDELVSPVTVAGTADVFEARVGVRIVDEGGEELAAFVTTATCRTGCPGPFSATLSFFTDRRQPGAIEVFAPGVEDGSETGLVSIPVVLVPGS